MTHCSVTPRTVLYRTALVLTVLGVSTMGAYGVTRALRGISTLQSRPVGATLASADTSYESPFPSGPYLVAFVLLASDCGFSAEKGTQKVIRVLRHTLRASHGSSFVGISVVGVSLDKDLDAGIQFLQGIAKSGAVFDEVSVGGTWLNEHVVRLVWREGLATPELPQVLLIERRVDGDHYPLSIDVQRDSVLLKVTGRDDLIAWVNGGTPLDFRPGSRAASLEEPERREVPIRVEALADQRR